MHQLPPCQQLNPRLTYNPLVTSLSAVHAACITQDHTIATFLPPLSTPKLTAYWAARAAEVSLGERIIVYIPAPASGPESGVPSGMNGLRDMGEGGKERDVASGNWEGEVMGVVMLKLDRSETGPFRGWIEKLLVGPAWRRRGVARAMMEEVERVARGAGAGLLMVDTEKESGAESVYPRLGWIEYGTIPRYAISPEDGSLRDEVFFYKDLR